MAEAVSGLTVHIGARDEASAVLSAFTERTAKIGNELTKNLVASGMGAEAAAAQTAKYKTGIETMVSADARKNIEDFHTKLQAATAQPERFAALREGATKFNESLMDIGKTAAGFALGGIALGIGAGIAEQFKEVLTGTVALGEGTRRLQLEIGGTAESISGLLAVMGRFGVSQESAERTLSLFSRGLRGDESASAATEANAKTFSGTLRELGVSATDTDGKIKPLTTVLLEAADGFKAHAADGQNAARAMALFGRSGRDLLPVLVLGREGIEELSAEAKRMGLELSQDNVTQIHSFVMAQKTMGESLEGLKVRLGVALMPGFAMFIDGALKAAQAAGDAAHNVLTWSSALSALREEQQRRESLGTGTQAEVNIPGQGTMKLPGTGGMRRVYIPGQGWIDVPAAELTSSAPPSEFANEQQAGLNLAAQAQKSTADQVTLTEQKKKLDDQITSGDRLKAIIEQDIAIKTRESLDLKKSEAELQLQIIPLKLQQADIDQQLLVMSDRRAGLERDAAVTRAQMAGAASSDALEAATYEERRLRLKIQADALAGRGVAAGDISALTNIMLSKPSLELADLTGNRPVTMAERARTRAQQEQDLASLPLRGQRISNEERMADLTAQSAAVQAEIARQRAQGVIDTTELQKKKQELDDQLFVANQKKADMSGNGIVFNIQQTITSSGEIDYDKVLQVTLDGVFTGLGKIQQTVPIPAPSMLPGARWQGAPY